MRSVVLTAVSIAMLAATAALAREGVRVVPGTSGPIPVAAKPQPVVDTEAAAPAPSPSPAAAQAGVDRGALTVTVNRAKVIRLPERAQTVVVGNPAIADLSLQKNGIVVVTGKSYGSTNLIAIDGAGNMLAESLVNVIAQTDGLVVVQRAFERYSYSCNPVCQPSVNLGDTQAYFNDARAQADAHNQFAVSR
jgi:Flp pilus assembly secretin CpaC